MALAVEHEFVPGFQRSTRPLFVLPGKHSKARINRPESEIVAFGEALYQMARQYRDTTLGMRDRWETHRSWYLESYNSHLQGTYLTGQTTENLIAEKIDHLAAQLTDGEPRILYLPESQADIAFTKIANDAIQHVWGAQDMDTLVYETIHPTLRYGTWYWKLVHDPRYGHTGGIVRFLPIPVWRIYPAPYATDPATAPWMIEVQIRTVGEILNDYGVHVDPEIASSQEFSPIEDHLKSYPISNVVKTVPEPGGPYAGGETVPSVPDSYLSPYGEGGGLVCQKELWIRDGATTPQFWMEHRKHDSVLRRTHTLKYPGGRVMSWANGRLLYDRPNPYADGEFPYVKFYDGFIDDFWYGLGETEGLINLQMLHNDTHDMLKLMHLYTAMGRLIVDQSTGLDEGSMSNTPGEVWVTDPGTFDRVRWLEGGRVPAEVYNYLHTLEQAADNRTGSPDVTRGINPTGVTAGKALMSLRAAANVRIRSRHKGTKRAFSRAARLFASRIQQFWPDELLLSILGPERRALLENDQVQFRQYQLTPEARMANYHVRVDPGINLEELREAEFQTLMMFYSMGILPPEMLIEGSNLHNREEILSWLPVMMARQRMMASQGGAAAPQGGQAK